MPFDYSKPLDMAKEDRRGLLDHLRQPEPSFSEIAGAAWRQENLIGSFMASPRRQVDDFFRVDDEYDVYSDIEGYEQHADRFEEVFNPEAAQAVKAGIDMEEKDRHTLAAGGWVGIGTSIGASLIDPTILLPGGALVRAGRGGYALGRSALSVGTAAAGATAIQELGLQTTQETRTVQESALNIGGSAILGGVLGMGVAKAFNHVAWSKAGKLLDEARAPEFDAATDVLHKELTDIADEARAQSAGAAAAPTTTLDDLSIAGGAASKVANATAQLNPQLRTMTSPSKAVRSIASQMMDTPVYLKKNLRGAGDMAAETAMHEYARGAVVQALEVQRKAYSEARKAGLKLTEREFREAVGMAMRRGDKSNLPGVEKAAAAWRKHVIEPLKDRAVSAGLLSEDVQVGTAESYFSRVYNRPLIEAHEGEFKQIVRDWLSGALDEEIARSRGRVDRRVLTLQREKNETELGILRRQEDMRQRVEAGEIDADDLPEAEIVQFIRRFNAGERPQQPERLSEWLRKQRDGIYDPNGELAAVLPELRKVPGLLRKSRKAKLNPKGGLGLDDIVLRAWEEGFLNDAGTVRAGARDTVSERPSIRDFLDALDADIRGEFQVRVGDVDAARSAADFERMLDAMSRAGVDFQQPRFATSEAMKDMAARVNRVLDDLDRERIARLNASLQETERRGFGDFLNDADREDYLNELVEEIYDKVTGRTYDGALPTDLKIGARGPLKERTFNIPDAKIEKFLDSDIEFVGRRYARLMSSDIELTERFGSPDMEGAFAEIKDDYKRLRAAAEKLPANERQKALDKLTAREKADIRDIEGVRDLLRGHYRPEVQHTTWARVGRAANTFNYMRALGGVVIASLTDAVRPAMVHGLKDYTSGAIVPLIRNLDAVKLSAKEAKIAGAISERALASRLATLAELTDPYAVRSPFERFLDNAATGFSRMTGLLHWNDFQKTIASVLTQNRILQNAETAAAKGFDALPKREQAYMGFLGVGEGRAEQLGKLFATHGETLDGVRVANSEAWGDDAGTAVLRRMYRAAINKDVDSIIVTKGVGDVPLLANTPLGRSLLQFRSFALASNQRVLIRGLQEDKARFVGGMVGMSTIGMFIYWLKQTESGRPVSDNPGTWVAEGLDRSGIFSVAFEINNALEKANAPGLYTGAAALFPDADQRQPASRYAVRSTVGSFLGPSFGGASDTVGLLSMGFENARRAVNGEKPALTPGDISAARRLTPYASLPYWRWFIDGMVVPELKEGLD
ncbi:hypothetical protein [Neoaquamicrobium sediminum]|uniref:hypothetical protein n=1 Tax=Neoaquamicrobium sediminum TaxID=1849104 RepID=UPI0036143004